MGAGPTIICYSPKCLEVKLSEVLRLGTEHHANYYPCPSEAQYNADYKANQEGNYHSIVFPQ
jgi:hypothetical protein